MATRNHAILFFSISALAACTAYSPSPRMHAGPQGRFLVPSGWRISWPQGSQGWVLTPEDQTQRVSIKVWSDFSSWELPDEIAAQQYLDYVNDTQDPNAALEDVGTVTNPEYGEHTIYGIGAANHSPANERLLIFMSHQNRAVRIDLFSADPSYTRRFLPILYSVVRSFRFNGGHE